MESISHPIQRGYHRLILPDGEVIPMAVVVFDQDGNAQSWHKLLQEEPGTIWVGGTYYWDMQN